MYERKILLGFMRVHILYHASESSGVYGAELIEELGSHGYSISPGTLYPMLHDMKKDGVLTVKNVKVEGKIRKVYFLTKKGEQTLDRLKKSIQELYAEVI